MMQPGTTGIVKLLRKQEPKMLQMISTSPMSLQTNKSLTFFEEKQKYMYAVFEKTLMTNKGKPWSVPTSSSIMFSKSTKSYKIMPFTLQKLLWMPQPYCNTSPQPILQMAIGKEDVTLLSSIGKTMLGSTMTLTQAKHFQ